MHSTENIIMIQHLLASQPGAWSVNHLKRPDEIQNADFLFICMDMEDIRPGEATESAAHRALRALRRNGFARQMHRYCSRNFYGDYSCRVTVNLSNVPSSVKYFLGDEKFLFRKVVESAVRQSFETNVLAETIPKSTSRAQN